MDKGFLIRSLPVFWGQRYKWRKVVKTVELFTVELGFRSLVVFGTLNAGMKTIDFVGEKIESFKKPLKPCPRCGRE